MGFLGSIEKACNHLAAPNCASSAEAHSNISASEPALIGFASVHLESPRPGFTNIRFFYLLEFFPAVLLDTLIRRRQLQIIAELSESCKFFVRYVACLGFRFVYSVDDPCYLALYITSGLIFLVLVTHFCIMGDFNFHDAQDDQSLDLLGSQFTITLPV